MLLTQPETCATEVTSTAACFKNVLHKSLTELTSDSPPTTQTMVSRKRKLSQSEATPQGFSLDDLGEVESSEGTKLNSSPWSSFLLSKGGETPSRLSRQPPIVLVKTRSPRKLRIVHDRFNPFLSDSLLETILSHFSLAQVQTAALVSKRWHLFAMNRLNHLLFTPDPTGFTDHDLQTAVHSLEQIHDLVQQRLMNLSQIRRERLTSRFYRWRDNGLHKEAMSSPPAWVFRLHESYGFPLSEFRTYTVDEVFNWLMNFSSMEDKSKEEWFGWILKSNVVAFVFRPPE